MSYENNCTSGDDITCQDMFTEQGGMDPALTCCMKIELESYSVARLLQQLSGDENMDAEAKTQMMEGFAALGLPSAVGDSIHMCS